MARIDHSESISKLYRPDRSYLDSYWIKCTTVFLSILFAFCTSGVVLGISAMNEVLLDYEKAFANSCPNVNMSCQAQLDQIALATTTALTAVALVFLPFGAFLDYFGPRITVCLSSIIFAVGCLALAFAKNFSNSLYFVGFFCLAVGGPPIFMSVTNFSELFPESKEAIIATQVGAFQVSSIIMVFIQQAVTKFGFTLHQVFLFYLIVPLAIFVCSLLLFPDEAYGTDESRPGQRGEPHRLWLIRRILLAKEAAKSPPHDLEGSGEAQSLTEVLLAPEDEIRTPPRLYNIDFWTQISSGPFLSVTFVISFFILTLNYFITTVSQQMQHDALLHGLTGREAVAVSTSLTSTFNLVLSVGAICGVPASGLVLLRWGLPPAFLCVGIINLIFLILITFAQIPLNFQVVAFAAFAFNRPFIFGAFSAYMADIFGFANFGKLFGLAQLGGAIITPLQFAFVLIVENFLSGSYFYINLGFLLVALFFVSTFPYYITTYIFSGLFLRPPVPKMPKGLNIALSEDDLNSIHR